MSRDNLASLLDKYGSDLEVDLSLDEDGFTLVRINDRIELSISFDDATQCVVLAAACGRLPEDMGAQHKLLLEMLDANFRWAGTGGATIATNSQEGTVHIQFREPTDRLEDKRLGDLFQAIVHNAKLWADRLETGNWESSAATPEQADAEEHADHHLLHSHNMIRI